MIGLMALFMTLAAATPAEAARRNIRGRIYLDVNGDGSLAGDSQAGGVTVRLYQDANDNGILDGPDSFVAEQTVNPSGRFQFRVQTNWTGRNYLVVVDSRSVTPVSGFNGGYSQADVWAQQTIGDDPATGALDVGPRFGGLNPGVSDNFNQGSTALGNNAYQHVARVQTNNQNVNDVDFGFSFNVVTNTLGGNNTVVQGSLRQFLVNANAETGDNIMRFVPAVPANAGGGSWWQVAHTATLPTITDAGTTVDGTAYSAIDGTSLVDSNAGILGTGGTVGAGGLPLAGTAGPELEITGSNGTRWGLRIQADLVTVRNVSVHSFSSFSWNAVMGAILVESGAGTLVENCVLGSGPGAFADPGAWRSAPNIVVAGATAGTVRGCLIGFGFRHGVEMRAGSSGWLFEGNEIHANALVDGQQNGISIDGVTGVTVTGNLIHGNGGSGIDATGGTTGVTLTDNTLRGNGIAGTGNAETAGARLDGSNNQIIGNLLEANYGAGVLVTAGSSGNTLSMNATFANGTITNRIGIGPTGQIGIDLLVGGDNVRGGTAPFVTLNDVGDGDAGGNGLLNFPALESAGGGAGILSVAGWARPGSIIELFIAEPDPSGLGEGRTWIATVTEGSAADLDGTAGTYGPVAVNGILVGQDNTNRFLFNIPLPAGVVQGTRLTATATLGGSTSEFGGLATVLFAVPNILVSKTAITESDPTNLTTNPKAIPGAVVMNMISATNTGTGAADADALTVTDPIPVATAVFVGDVGGAGSGPVLYQDGAVPGGMTYSFGGLADPGDDLEFSSDGGATWAYTPVPDAAGFDPAVTHLRVRPKGAFAASDGVNHPGFSVSFKTRVQ